MTTYIRFPIDTNAESLRLQVYAYIQARSAQWSPNDGNLDTWIIQAFATLAADIRDLASDVQDTIFRYFGATLMSLPPIDAASSTVVSTWTMRDNAGYTIPAGTQVGLRNTSGDIIPFETLGAVVVPAGSTATAAGAVTLRSINTGAISAGLAAQTATLLTTLDFVTTVATTAVSTGGTDAEDDQTYLNRLSTRLRLLSTRPILPPDFAILARDIAGVYRAVGIDGYNPFHNLLTLNQASLETDTTGWIAGSNTTLSNPAVGSDGAKSLGLTSVAAGAISGNTNPTNTPALAVSPGETITGVGRSRAATTLRSSRLDLYWFTSANIFISATLGAAANNSTSAFVDYTVTGVAPPTASFVVLVTVNLATAAAAELHYWDRMSIRRGSGTDWVPGGTPETGNARSIGVSALDTLGADVSGTIQTQIANLLQANREVNFLVYVIPARRQQIAVTFAAKAMPGYTTADVKARAEAAVADYLNPAKWGSTPADAREWIENPIVRYSEVAQVISNTEGLDYWTSLTIGTQGGTMGTVDLTLPKPASLATAGTITGTIT